MSKRKYTRLKNLEPEIIKMREEGMCEPATGREVLLDCHHATSISPELVPGTAGRCPVWAKIMESFLKSG